MRRLLFLLSAGACLLALSASWSFGQTHPHPKPGQAHPAVKGTAQMAGDNGKIGLTYTLGKGGEAINFALTRLEYVGTRVARVKRTVTSRGDEKLLVLHFMVQNPNPDRQQLNASTFRFSAYDAEGTTYLTHGDEYLVRDPSAEEADITLMPGQKVNVVTSLSIPAKAAVTKLMVERRDQKPVLRISLGPKDTTPLAAPIADPADPSGASALPDYPATPNTYNPMGQFDVKVDGVAYETGEVGNHGTRPHEGHRWCIVTITLRNAGKQNAYVNVFDTRLKTSDGDRVHWDSRFRASNWESPDTELQPGEENTQRWSFEIPSGATATEFTMWEGEYGRRVTFRF